MPSPLLSHTSPPFVHLFSDEKAFPTLEDAPTLLLSVIVPAFKEMNRIKVGMAPLFEHLIARSKREASFTWEVIVVDDGSKEKKPEDQTSEIVLRDFVAKYGPDK